MDYFSYISLYYDRMVKNTVIKATTKIIFGLGI